MAKQQETEAVRLEVRFFQTTTGKEPAKEWLKTLEGPDTRKIDADTMVLLHGFIKKSQSTPQDDIDTAKYRMKLVKAER
ncbi:type II toxin-antitoxin system RelE/ParE family toxin [Burkholderia guangdongensis]|uniref:type II toxin-antitoxin system RelE/ParE family toxin n=1 Tax=Burkholderia guangdongensis TaxID=1792500 RepID=UPI0015C74B68|nr:type II toxin-antitoxin system RelE/ParE family toxin [Burkholderia guangdongensis]